MNIGNASWGFRETPLEKQLEITSKMGLELLELGIAGHDNDFLQLDASGDKIEKVRSMFASKNVKLYCASTGNNFTYDSLEEAEADIAKVKKVIDIASKLGIRYLRIFSGWTTLDKMNAAKLNTMLKALAEVTAYGLKHKVIPAVETHGAVEGFDKGVKHIPSSSTDSESLKRIFLAAPGLVMNYDPANMVAAGYSDQKTFIKTFKDRIEYMHLKDFAPVAGTDLLRPAACGEGPVDWKTILTELKAYKGSALIEYEVTEDIEDGLKRSLEFIRKVQKSI